MRRAAALVLEHDSARELDPFRRPDRRKSNRAGGRGRRRETAAALTRAMAVHYGPMVDPGSKDELETLLLEARRGLDDAGDHEGLVHVWPALGFGVANIRGRSADWAATSEQARYHSRLAARSSVPLTDSGIPMATGSRPADGALEVVDRWLSETRTPFLLLARGWLLGMLNRPEEAWHVTQEGGRQAPRAAQPLGRLDPRRAVYAHRRP